MEKKFTSRAIWSAMMRRRGHLDHGADRQLAVEGDAFFFQVLLDLGQDHLALAQLQQRADHGEHDAHVAERTGP